MSYDQNLDVVRRVVLAINTGDLNTLTNLFTPNYVEHDPAPGTPAGLEGLRTWLRDFRTAFPDLKYTTDDEITMGDKVVQRLTGQATMRGPFMGMQPTGKHATWSEIHISRLSNGKIVEHWGVVDQVTMMQQLGVMPATMTR